MGAAYDPFNKNSVVRTTARALDPTQTLHDPVPEAPPPAAPDLTDQAVQTAKRLARKRLGGGNATILTGPMGIQPKTLLGGK